MSRKITLGAALAMALLLVATSIPLTMLYSQRLQNRIIQDLPARIEEFKAMEEIRGLVQDNFYDRIRNDDITAATVRGYIEGLGDSESRYLPADEYETYLNRLLGQRPETGLELTYIPPLVEILEEEDAPAEEKNGYIMVSSVKDGSPAAVSGLQAGDVILKAESAETLIYDAAQLRRANSGEMLSALLEFEINAAKNPAVSITFTFKRDNKTLPPANVMFGSSVSSVSSELMKGKTGENVGYIKIFYFMRTTADDLEAAMKEFGRANATSYVFDLRGCAEGSIEYACKSLDLFLPMLTDNDVLATIQYNNKKTKTFPSSAASEYSYAMNSVAVLTNGATSGAAELFAYNLWAYYFRPDQSPVILVGQETAGVHTVQEAFPLRQVGGAALITVGTVLPYRGEANWRVEPTLRVGSEELMLAMAIDTLTQETPQKAEEM